MACVTTKQLLHGARAGSHMQLTSPLLPPRSITVYFAATKRSCKLLGNRNLTAVVVKASPRSDSALNEEDGVSLGTMKLPANTDLGRFETLLFQWGNSFAQGANLPLPTPLKVDKIAGGARLGFTSIGSDDQIEVLAYIDCLVYPATDGSGPIFRAVRKGPKKNSVPPGEARIMRSLLEALNKCVQIATTVS